MRFALGFIAFISSFAVVRSAFFAHTAQQVLVEYATNSPVTDLEQFWDKALSNAREVIQKAKQKLDDVPRYLPDVTGAINEFKNEMDEFGTMVKHFLEHRHFSEVDMHSVLEKWQDQCGDIYRQIQEEFTVDLPQNPTEREKQRDAMISTILTTTEESFMEIIPTTISQDKQDSIREGFKEINEKLRSGLLIAGRIIDNHPVLAEVILTSVIAWIIPTSLFLRPFLSLFGWGPLGPVKGTFAAWAQRMFWGAAVKEGSWFAIIDSIAMGGSAFLARFIQAIIGAIGAMINSLLSIFLLKF